MRRILKHWDILGKGQVTDTLKKRPIIMPGVSNTSEGGMHYDKLVADGYQGNVIVYKCISHVAQAVGSVPLFGLIDGEKLPASHPLNQLLQFPKVGQTWAQFVQEFVGYYLLSGNAYIEMLMTDEGGPQELATWRPDRVEIKPGKYGFPEAYVYKVDDYARKAAVDQSTGASAVLHFKNWHPKNDWYGLSPLEAAARSVDQHNDVAKHNIALLRNGGRPSGVLLLKPDEYGTTLTEEQRELLREDLRALHEGESNAGRMMIIEGNFEWREMGLSPRSMDFMEGKLLSAREIAQAFGVPSMLVGIPGDATFSNYREARYHLWEETVLPLLDGLIAAFTHWLKVWYQEDALSISYDTEKIHALAPRREKKWERIEQASFLTINEKRAAFGYAPIEGGDTYPAVVGGDQ